MTDAGTTRERIIAAARGWLGTPYLSGPLWHAHEIIFGFVLAVIVGFLFTAGRNWSNQPTPTGAARPSSTSATRWSGSTAATARRKTSARPPTTC